VVVLAAGALGVVEVFGPGGAAEAGEGPFVHRVGEVAVAGEPVGDDQVALAGAAGDWGAPGIALQRVQRGELLDVLAGLTGDPGGETATEARKAQVDLAARKRVPRLVLRFWLAGLAQQDRAVLDPPNPIRLPAPGKPRAPPRTIPIWQIDPYEQPKISSSERTNAHR
jgi:hypothetical protein